MKEVTVKMGNMFKHLTPQDLEEGKKIMAMYSGLPEMERMQARIYIGALSDRNKIVEDLEVVDSDKAVRTG